MATREILYRLSDNTDERVAQLYRSLDKLEVKPIENKALNEAINNSALAAVALRLGMRVK